MANQSRTKRASSFPTEETRNGLLDVRFTFNGKTYRRTHQLTGNEQKGQKLLLDSEGPNGVTATIWRATFWGGRRLVEGAINDAIKGYLVDIDYAEAEVRVAATLTDEQIKQAVAAYESPYDLSPTKE